MHHYAFPLNVKKNSISSKKFFLLKYWWLDIKLHFLGVPAVLSESQGQDGKFPFRETDRDGQLWEVEDLHATTQQDSGDVQHNLHVLCAAQLKHRRARDHRHQVSGESFRRDYAIDSALILNPHQKKIIKYRCVRCYTLGLIVNMCLLLLSWMHRLQKCWENGR